MSRRHIERFRYMVWAKEHQPLATYNLGLSGLAPPQTLDLTGAPDLAQRGGDMPPDARLIVAERQGVPIEQVVLTLGTSHAMYLVCASNLQPGDRCLVETPAYELLPNLPGLFGAEAIRFERAAQERYRIPSSLLERVEREHPRMVLLTNPHNPTAAYLSPDELRPLAEACGRGGSLLVVDEVYLEYLAGPEGLSASQLGPQVVSASSLTKAYGFGTTRFGWLLGAAPVVERAIRYNDYISVLYPNPCAWVGLQALRALPSLQARAAKYRVDNLPIVDAWIAEQPRVSWHRSESGVVGLIAVDGLTDTIEFCSNLLRDRATLAVPGDFFEAPGHLRIGFGIDEAQLREGLSRLGAALR